MRLAKVQDEWRTVYARQYMVTVDRCAYEGVRGLGSGLLEFSGGLSAICGANGVGKTALLTALLGVTNPDAFTEEKVLRLRGAVLKADLRIKGQVFTRIVSMPDGTVDPLDLELEVAWVDCPFACPDMITFFAGIDNLDEQLEAEGGFEASQEDLRLLSYIVGKPYTRLKSYELEFADRGIVPYFRATADTATYGSESMGLGELSANYIMWHLKRAAKNSILLIEEPESYLAPRSQEALTNVLAKICADKGVWAVLTTHSPSVLANIPPAHVRFISRVGNDVRVVTPHNQAEYFIPLGMTPKRSAVLVVEDRAAREFATAWLGYHDPHLGQLVQIADAKDSAKVREALTFPKLGPWLTIVGLLDGDARRETVAFYADNSKEEKRNWPYTFLPTESPPDHLLWQTARENVDQIADRLGRDSTLVHTALSVVEGGNHHDWIDEFSRAIHSSYEAVVKASFEVWVTNDQNRTMSLEALEQLRQILAKKS